MDSKLQNKINEFYKMYREATIKKFLVRVEMILGTNARSGLFDSGHHIHQLFQAARETYNDSLQRLNSILKDITSPNSYTIYCPKHVASIIEIYENNSDEIESDLLNELDQLLESTTVYTSQNRKNQLEEFRRICSLTKEIESLKLRSHLLNTKWNSYENNRWIKILQMISLASFGVLLSWLARHFN